MNAKLSRLGTWLHARAENLLAAMLAIMFAVFIIQIVFRYVVNLPIGWTNEISVIMWIWLVLFFKPIVAIVTVVTALALPMTYLIQAAGFGLRTSMATLGFALAAAWLVDLGSATTLIALVVAPIARYWLEQASTALSRRLRPR